MRLTGATYQPYMHDTDIPARTLTLYQRLQSLRVVIAATVVLGVLLASTVSYLG